MSTFLALYHGDSIGAARVLAVTAEPTVVREFATRLLDGEEVAPQSDTVLRELEAGRRGALRLVRDGAAEG